MNNTKERLKKVFNIEKEDNLRKGRRPNQNCTYPNTNKTIITIYSTQEIKKKLIFLSRKYDLSISEIASRSLSNFIKNKDLINSILED